MVSSESIFDIPSFCVTPSLLDISFLLLTSREIQYNPVKSGDISFELPFGSSSPCLFGSSTLVLRTYHLWWVGNC